MMETPETCTFCGEFIRPWDVPLAGVVFPCMQCKDMNEIYQPPRESDRSEQER